MAESSPRRSPPLSGLPWALLNVLIFAAVFAAVFAGFELWFRLFDPSYEPSDNIVGTVLIGMAFLGGPMLLAGPPCLALLWFVPVRWPYLLRRAASVVISCVVLGTPYLLSFASTDDLDQPWVWILILLIPALCGLFARLSTRTPRGAAGSQTAANS